VAQFVRERPAWEVLEGLARLYTSPPDRWYWERARGPHRYVLRHTVPLARAQEAREAFLEEFLIGQHRRMQQFARLSPEERRRAEAGDPFLAALNHNPERNLGKVSVLSAVPEAALRAAFRGAPHEIPLDSLTPVQREWWRREHEYNGSARPDEAQRALRLFRQDASLVLYLGESAGGAAALGGVWTQKPLEEFAARGWRARDESVEPEDRPFPAPAARHRPEDLALAREADGRHAERYSRLGEIDILVDLARRGTHSARGRLGPRLADALAALAPVRMLWKRWNSLYLWRPVDWQTRSVDALAPWPLLRDLRRSAAENDGYLRPADWLALAEEPRARVEALQQEFPDCAQVLQFQSLLRLIGSMNEREQAALARPGGGAWLDFTGATKQRLLTLFPAPDARALRLHLRWEAARPPTARLYAGIGPPRPITIPFAPRVPPTDPPGAPRPARD